MGFTSFKDYNDKVVKGGQSLTTYFRKITPTTNFSVGTWFDGSVCSGNPVTNFYASTPLVAAKLSSREGLFHGTTQSPAKKYLKTVAISLTANANAPVNFIFLDLLLYYPFIDGDSTDTQVFTNTEVLDRFTDGENVRAFVVAQGAYTGGAEFRITYTNQDGVSDRKSAICVSNTTTVPGALITSPGSAGGRNVFGWSIPLAPTDRGIRSVQDFTFFSGNGGIFALVLAKELGSMSAREPGITAEKDFLLDSGFSLPEIHDNAFLSFILSANGSIANTPFLGSIQTVWG
jgi:hypothetical protein